MVLVKLFSRWRKESIAELTLISAAATRDCRKSRDFPIWTAKRSVGVGARGFEVSVFVSVGVVVRLFAAGRGGKTSLSSYIGFLD